MGQDTIERDCWMFLRHRPFLCTAPGINAAWESADTYRPMHSHASPCTRAHPCASTSSPTASTILRRNSAVTILLSGWASSWL